MSTAFTLQARHIRTWARYIHGLALVRGHFGVFFCKEKKVDSQRITCSDGYASELYLKKR
jgi:hypothetical protein